MARASDGRCARQAAVLIGAVTLALLVGAGCPQRTDLAQAPENGGNMSFTMQVFTSDQGFADLCRSMDSTAKPMECDVLDGKGSIFTLSRYQWARINAMSKAETHVRRTFRDKFLISDSVEFRKTVRSDAGQTIDVRLTVVPDSCCTFTLSDVHYRLADEGGTQSVTFWSAYPQVSDILVELAPTAAGRQHTWILMDVDELKYAAP